MNHPTEAEFIDGQISARAQELWRIAGRPHGRDLEFWLAAENRISRERAEIDRELHEFYDLHLHEIAA